MLKHGKKASDKQSIVQFFLQPELGNCSACIKGSLSSSKEHLDHHLFFAADSLPWLVWNISSKSVSANEVLWSIISGVALWYIWIWKSRNARVFGNNNNIQADCIVSVIRGLACRNFLARLRNIINSTCWRLQITNKYRFPHELHAVISKLC